jgi:arylformamidase
MTPDLRAKIAALGTALTPELMGATGKLMAAGQPAPLAGVTITRDHYYGPDERHRLDIFSPVAASDAPVLVYVHGGGFVMGDKTSPGSPFYDNVGRFAACHGMVGVTITYRLAPAHKWPSGPDDLALVVDWLRAHIAAHGGNPERIFLMGQSAGAVHVAGYVAHRSPRIAGAIMLSALFDLTKVNPSPLHAAYYGDDPALYAVASTAEGLIASTVPLLITVSEYDMPDFQLQAADFAARWAKARGTFPPLLWLHGHNHMTPGQILGSRDDDFGQRLLDFVASGSLKGRL